MSAFLHAGALGSGIVLLLVSVAASPLSDWWVANAITNFRLQLATLGLMVLAFGLLLRIPHVALMGAAVVVVNGAVVVDRLRPPATAGGPPAAGQALRIMSLNLLFSNRDVEAVFGLVERVQPDVVLFQEVGAFWADALRGLRDPFPYSVARPRVGSAHGHGVLLLSRHPILAGERLTLGGPSTRLAAARLVVGNHTLWVGSVHAVKPNGPANLALQQRQLEQLAAWVNARAGPVLLGGDLNATSYAPQVRRLLAATGLVLDQQASPAQAFASTFPAILPLLGLKLDHILVRDMAIRQAWTLPPVGSDHRAVVTDLVLPDR